jgi:acyl carrier protein
LIPDEIGQPVRSAIPINTWLHGARIGKETTMTVSSRDEIFDKIKEVLENALGVDPEEVTMDATLIGDLGAESIDFLDISFKLEQEFSIKIEQGELFPENLMSDDSLVEDGKLTDKAMEILKERMPHVDFTKLDNGRSVDQLSEVFTVASLVDFVQRKTAS